MFGSLFTGIGGLDLGLERAGMECAWQVEIDDFCRRVLAKHWPDVPKWEDVREVDGRELERVDLVCGSFPCQPVSYAGKRLGDSDERWVWPEFARMVRVLRPRYVLVENVPGLLNRHMGEVLGDLSALGYDAEWESVPAAAFGAPHLRWRVFIVAYADEEHGDDGGHGAGEILRRRSATTKLQGQEPDAPDPHREGKPQPEGLVEKQRRRAGDFRESLPDPDGAGCVQQRRPFPVFPEHSAPELCGSWEAEPAICRVADGFPGRVDRLRGLGNAVVPQKAEWLGALILDHARRVA